jgi:hypothetical protein
MTKTRKNTKRASASRSQVSSSPFLSALATPPVAPNFARTENGAASLATTTSAVLDWFAAGGAMRNQEEAQIQAVFAKAFAEDRLLATKVAFYIRDVRGGQGQRKAFRAVLSWLAQNYPAVVKKNLALVPEFGRWDDVLVLLDSPLLRDEAVALIHTQLRADLRAAKKGDNVSLLGKWLPSANTSSAATRAQAVKLTKLLDYSPREYRKALTLLRSKANVVERAMCSKDWTGIDYEKVPSRASMLYREAFSKHDPVGYTKWKGAVVKGEAKINAGTLYPYELVTKAMSGEYNETLELLWRGLPNMFEGKVTKALVVCDVSGSMHSPQLSGSKATPLHVAISLAMYCAERCEGPFKDNFITFSGSPELVKLQGASLYDRATNLSHASWGMNTNVQAVFDLILDRAVRSKLKQSDLPEALYIVSDMQFDSCGASNTTNLELVKQKFARAGYQAPLLVFWQVRPTADKVALKNENGVVMVSGFSPNALKAILKLEQPQEVTPYDAMLATVNTERYESIRV